VPKARVLLERATEQLARAGVPTPRVDAELLLAHVTGRPRLTLGLVGEIPPDQERAFTALVVRRAAREPLQHLTGSAPFRHLELQVGPGVFVPRPETELLVDEALAHLGRRSREFTPASRAGASGARGPILVDLCAGSGALALSLAVEVPGARVLAVELSEDALAWAGRNLDACAELVSAAGSSLRLVAADATKVAEEGAPLADLLRMVEVVLTNPPYVPDAAVPREREVRDHDPQLALYGGPDGLAVIRPLARQAARLLRPGGLLLVEHADVQGEDAGPLGVPGVLRAMGGPDHPDWREVTDHLDLAGRPRFTSAICSGQDRIR
jgi:release factor glutamine methyltransferase